MDRRGNRLSKPDRRAVLAGAGAVAATAGLTACNQSQVEPDADGRIRL
ncbi:MAG: twin-arginine translocation signal domain-containing protein, partial [Alphaproteobacteria bacterium]